MPSRSQGKLHAQRTMARLDEKDVHRWVFAHSMDPDVESAVRIPHVIGPMLARTHIMLNNARGLNARDAVKALIKATGLNPHLSVCGWPFCLDDVDDAHAEGGAA